MPRITLLILLVPALAAAQTGEEIIKKMDENMTFKTRTATCSLTSHKPGAAPDVRTLRMWARGWDDSFSEFQSPARDKGVKYLKLQKSLYMYLPRTEKVVTISGHMLRQSVMDSDFSYEDMLESRALLNDYNVKVLGSEPMLGEDSWQLELTAKREDVTYPKRKMWVGKKTYIPLRTERYAASGQLLKVMSSEGVTAVKGGRYYPMKWTMEDKMRKGTKSVLSFDDIQFDAAVDDGLFSRRNLMKGN